MDHPRKYAGKVIFGNAFHVMESPEWLEAFDVIITDPPYRMERRRNLSRKGRKNNALVRDFGEEPGELDVETLASLFSNALKPDASALIWCSYEQLVQWKQFLPRYFTKQVNGVWCKTNPAPSIYKRTFVQATEPWIWVGRGKYAFNADSGYHLLNYEVLPHMGKPESLGHPNQKPEAIIRRMVGLLAPPGGLVLDPFAGACTVGAMCKSLGIDCVSIEKNKHWVEVGQRRIDSTKEQLSLDANGKPTQISLL